MEIGSSKKRRPRRSSWWKPILTILVILLAIRLALPFMVQSYVNTQLEQLDGYGGHVDGVSLRVLRGSYTLQNVRIGLRAEDVPAPLFHAERVTFAIQWSEVFRGKLTSGVRMEGVDLHVTVSPGGVWQDGAGVDWAAVLRELAPVRVDLVEVRGGVGHFSDLQGQAPVHVFLSDIAADLRNLQNARDDDEDRFATMRLRGRPMGGGRAVLTMDFAPHLEAPSFEMSLQLTSLDLTALNPLLQAYGNYDVQSGEADVYASVWAVEHRYGGRATSFFQDLTVQQWREPAVPAEDEEDGLTETWPLSELWDEIREPAMDLRGEAGALVLRAPFSGRFDDPDVGLVGAVPQILREVAVHGLVHGLELAREGD